MCPSGVVPPEKSVNAFRIERVAPLGFRWSPSSLPLTSLPRCFMRNSWEKIEHQVRPFGKPLVVLASEGGTFAIDGNRNVRCDEAKNIILPTGLFPGAARPLSRGSQLYGSEFGPMSPPSHSRPGKVDLLASSDSMATSRDAQPQSR